MILVTGATGNNGRKLVRQLVAAGQRVRALVRNPDKAADLKGSNVELVVGDFDHPATLNAALQGVDKAFLLTPVRNILLNGKAHLSRRHNAPS